MRLRIYSADIASCQHEPCRVHLTSQDRAWLERGLPASFWYGVAQGVLLGIVPVVLLPVVLLPVVLNRPYS